MYRICVSRRQRDSCELAQASRDTKALMTRTISGLLCGVRSYDPLTLAVIAMLLLMVTILAAYLPARRATRVDPLVALRSE